VGVATSTGNARKRVRKIQHRLAATVSWQEERHHIHPTYRGCSHAKQEMRRRKISRTPKPSMGRVFFSKYTTSNVSFAEALQSNAIQARLQRQLQ
jgi:hypothetical protein